MSNAISVSSGIYSYSPAANVTKVSQRPFVSNQTDPSAFDAASAVNTSVSDNRATASKTEQANTGSALFDQLRAQLAGSQSASATASDDSNSSGVLSIIDTNRDGTISPSELQPLIGANDSSAASERSFDQQFTSLVNRYASVANGYSTSERSGLSVAV